MVAHKKEFDEIDKIAETLSTDTPTNSRPKGFSRILKPTLISVLAILCLTGGIFLHKTHMLRSSPKATNLSLVNNQNKSFRIATQPVNSLLVQKAQPTPFSPLEPAQVSNEIEKSSPIFPTAEEKVSSSTSLEVDNQTDNTPTPSPKQKMDGFSLADALLFKEHFLTEDSCYEDYQKLLNTSHKTPIADEVLNNLSPYCLSHQSAVQNVQTAFLKNKKMALIAYYKENNPKWLAYLKAIPASLIEIRKVNPLTDTPKDILYKAQNEIDSQNISLAVNFVTQLPLGMQQKMTDFYREAAIYNRAKNSIDQLILSFEEKGE